jgi:hypothetical protein
MQFSGSSFQPFLSHPQQKEPETTSASAVPGSFNGE